MLRSLDSSSYSVHATFDFTTSPQAQNIDSVFSEKQQLQQGFDQFSIYSGSSSSRINSGQRSSVSQQQHSTPGQYMMSTPAYGATLNSKISDLSSTKVSGFGSRTPSQLPSGFDATTISTVKEAQQQPATPVSKIPVKSLFRQTNTTDRSMISQRTPTRRSLAETTTRQQHHQCDVTEITGYTCCRCRYRFLDKETLKTLSLKRQCVRCRALQRQKLSAPTRPIQSRLLLTKPNWFENPAHEDRDNNNDDYEETVTTPRSKVSKDIEFVDATFQTCSSSGGSAYATPDSFRNSSYFEDKDSCINDDEYGNELEERKGKKTHNMVLRKRIAGNVVNQSASP